MRNTRRILVPITLVLAALTAPVFAQKRPVNHDDYDKWPSIRSTAYSPDGKWMAYVVQPSWGDGVMRVREVDGKKRFLHARGSGPRFTADGRFVIFSIRKSVEEEHKKKLEKLNKSGGKGLEAEAKKKAAEEEKQAEERRQQMIARFSRGRRGRRGSRGGSTGGSGKMGVMNLATGKVEIVEKTKGFRVIKDGTILVYHLEAPEKKKEKKSDAKTTEEKPAEGTGREQRRSRSGGVRSGRRGSGGRRRGAGTRSPSSRGSSGGASGGGSSRGGTQLTVRDFATGKETKFAGVSRYQTVAKDEWLLLTLNASKPGGSATTGSKAAKDAKTPKPAKKGIVKSGLVAVRLADGKQVRLFDGAASFSSFTTDRHHKKLVFTSDITDKLAAERKKKAAAEKAKKAAAEKAKKAAAEKAKKAAGKKKAESEKPQKKIEGKNTEAEKKDPKPRQEIFLWEFDERAPRQLVAHATKGIPDGATVQSSGLSFSGDASVLTFSIRGKPKPDLAKILPEEKVVVDIWHWNDGYIQSMQAKRRGSSGETRTCALHLADGRVTVLGDELIPSMSLLTHNGDRALATDSKPYEKLVTWDGRYSDVYVVNTRNGSRRKLITKLRGRTSTSPSGRYVLYFGQDYQWYSVDVVTKKQRCLTSGLNVSFQNVLDDRPQPSSAYGIVGWTKGDEHVLINDRYDIWKISMLGGETTCVTDGFGRENRIVLRYSRFDLEGDDDTLSPDEKLYLPDTILLTAKNDITKARGYYTDTVSGVDRPKKLLMIDRSIGGLTRAKKADRLFFTVSTFAEFPDVWVADMRFRQRRKLTDACPLQRRVRWGRSEVVNWTNGDGVQLKGILIKPEGFDPRRKYPMMVYFYERNSDNVHRYTKPSAGTSPNAAYYVSNGYLWFVPDIVYTIGYPGESAEKCIISGVQHLIAQGFVDRKAIGTAGHSWGGYQTAHLVTRSNLFAAAESGAPVSNMFSAYGGIRYSSGMSRQFQYERTQSRIGGTPWQHPQRYWQNSPLFYADRVKTPVLILHNDNDGAVPWTNGLEFFMALRRLGKEAYLFNYNGEPHGLRKTQNKKDWTRRMAEFFDHHLRGNPAPKWMTEGVPYAERDREKIQYAPSFIDRKKRKASAIGTSTPPTQNQVGNR